MKLPEGTGCKSSLGKIVEDCNKSGWGLSQKMIADVVNKSKAEKFDRIKVLMEERFKDRDDDYSYDDRGNSDSICLEEIIEIVGEERGTK